MVWMLGWCMVAPTPSQPATTTTKGTVWRKSKSSVHPRVLWSTAPETAVKSLKPAIGEFWLEILTQGLFLNSWICCMHNTIRTEQKKMSFWSCLFLIMLLRDVWHNPCKQRDVKFFCLILYIYLSIYLSQFLMCMKTLCFIKGVIYYGIEISMTNSRSDSFLIAKLNIVNSQNFIYS